MNDKIEFLANMTHELSLYNKINKHKMQRILSIKDSYYSDLLELWHLKDEIEKYELSKKIWTFINKMYFSDNRYRKYLLVVVLVNLGRVPYFDDNYIVSLQNISVWSGIDFLNNTDLAVKLNVLDCLKMIKENSINNEEVLSKNFEFTKAFLKVFSFLEDEVSSHDTHYLGLIDSAYWLDVAESIGNYEDDLDLFFENNIKNAKALKDRHIISIHSSKYEYIRGEIADIVSKLRDICDPSILKHDNDSLLNTFVYIASINKYMEIISVLMPSWLTVRGKTFLKKDTFLKGLIDQCPNSHFFWFSVLLLTAERTFQTGFSVNNLNIFDEIIRPVLDKHSQKFSLQVKFINANLPPAVEENDILSGNIINKLNSKNYYDALIEYSYYLYSLHSKFGLSPSRKSWYRNNLIKLFEKWNTFLKILQFVISSRAHVGAQEDSSLRADAISNQLGGSLSDQEQSAQDISSISEVSESHADYSNEYGFLIYLQPDCEDDSEIRLLEMSKINTLLVSFLKENSLLGLGRPEIILSTIKYFYDCRNNSITTRSPIWINDTLWNKLRRGKLRILLRQVGNNIIFHVYKRKDYHPKKFDN